MYLWRCGQGWYKGGLVLGGLRVRVKVKSRVRLEDQSGLSVSLWLG